MFKRLIWLGLGPLLLAGCLFNNTPEVIDHDAVWQGFLGQLEVMDLYQIKMSDGASLSARLVVSGNDMRSEFESPEGRVEMVYVGDEMYLKQPGSERWLHLSIGRNDPAADAAKWDVWSLTTDDSQSLKYEYVETRSCLELVCDVFETRYSGNAVRIWIDTTDHWVRKVEVTGDRLVEMEYGYDDEGVDVPELVEDYSIPDNPDELDLEKLQQIYGN